MRHSAPRETQETCDAVGCEEKAERSISRNKAEKAVPDMKLESGDRRVHLCKKHYREFKKATKDDRKMESLRR